MNGSVGHTALAVMLAGITAATAAGHFTPMADGIATVYLLSYEAGFLRNALPGTLLGPVADPAVFAHRVAVFGFIVLTANALLLFYLAHRAAQRGRLGAVTLAVLLCSSPLTVGFFAWDLGRPVQAGYVLALAGVVAMLLRRPRGWLAPAALAILTAVGLAIHASFVLIQLPLLVAIYRDRAVASPSFTSSIRPDTVGAGLAAFGVVCVIMILWFGVRDTGFAQAFLDDIRMRYPEAMPPPILAQAHGPMDAVAEVGRALGTPRNLKGIASMLIVLPIYAVAVVWALKESGPARDGPRRRHVAATLLIATLPPLLLCAVHPHMSRWGAYAATNLLVAGCSLVGAPDGVASTARTKPGLTLLLPAVTLHAVLPGWNMFGGFDAPDPLQGFVTDCLLGEPPRLDACTR